MSIFMDRLVVIALCSLLWISCGQEQGTQNADAGGSQTVKFSRVAPEETGVNFRNNIVENAQVNYLIYDGMYQGAGVGVGDFNNDGLQDLYFAGNMVGDKLYFNKGNFEFEDVTVKAGIREHGGWSTGVTVADLNNDGWQDIYVSQFLWEDSMLSQPHCLAIGAMTKLVVPS